jgi:hypothetical protein
MMETSTVRELATQVAPLLPGNWHAEWQSYTVGAYLVSGDMRLFVSAQGGSGHKPGMIEISPHLPKGGAYEDPKNKSARIYVGEKRTPEAFAREIHRRIIVDQDYPAKVERQVEYIRKYEAAEGKANDLAMRLGEILEAPARENSVDAWPHGTWRTGTDSAHLDIYLPEELALKIAKLIKEEM